MKHPNKHIQAALEYAVDHDWRVVKAGARAHIWGTIYCHHSDRSGCLFRVFSTPRNPENHAKHIKRAVDQCPH